MSISSSASESVLASALRPRLHSALQPLFNQSNPCLPALEKTCQKILSLADSMTSADRLAQLVSRDPGLTCKVLQVSNSVAYSPQQVITSVPHAVSWLGLDTVRSIVSAAQLVEQLHQWPDRQRVVSGIIARALVTAVHANELGMAIEYPSPTQLFSCALLYSIGDLAIANQAPEVFKELRAASFQARTPAARVAEETRLLGVPRYRLAEALAQLWVLPPYLQEVFATGQIPEGRWHTSKHSLKGLVEGCALLVEALTGPGAALAAETAKRPLLAGTGLSPHLFGEILVRALHRGKQLVEASGLSFETWDEGEPSAPQVGPHPAGPSAPIRRQPSRMDTHPTETLQSLQNTLREAKDLNTLLGTLLRALHDDGGFGRVALCLVNPHDPNQLVGRLALGVEPPDTYLGCLSGSLSGEHPYFLSLMKDRDPVLIEDFMTPMSAPINAAFLRLWNPTSGIVAPLRVGLRPIGLIYCDAGPVPNQVGVRDYQRFRLFFDHATVSMSQLAGRS